MFQLNRKARKEGHKLPEKKRAIEIEAPGMSEEQHSLHLRRDGGLEEGLTAYCTCGAFTYGPSTEMMELGLKAKEHSTATGHVMAS